MSKLLEFRRAERELAEQLALLESLKQDSELKREMEFEQQLKALMQQYGMRLAQVVDILDPPQVTIAQLEQLRRGRKVQVWKNPITGEVLHTRSGNNKTLKRWKAEHGESFVRHWLQKD